MRFLSDSFICNFCVVLEGHSFWGLQPTWQTAVSPPPKQVRHGNNKCERRALLKRPKLNCIDFLQSPKLLILFKSLSVCFLMSSGEDTLQLSCPVGCGEKGWGQSRGHVTSEPSPRVTPLREGLKEQGPADWSYPSPMRQLRPGFLLQLRQENMGRQRISKAGK